MSTTTRTRGPATRSTPSRELRVVSFTPERRAEGDGNGAIPFAGHAIVYDSWTEISDWWFGSYLERIQRGAAARTIAEDDIRLLVNHDPSLVLARRRGEPSDTLRLFDDAQGLAVEAELAPTSYGRDIALSLERGDVSGMSFAFEALAQEWDERPDGTWLRTITEIRMYDVAIVTYPAYPETDAALRSILPADLGRALVAVRAGRRNSAADEAVIRSAVDGLRSHADELESLIATAGDDDDEDERAKRAALAANQARRHRGLGTFLGFAR